MTKILDGNTITGAIQKVVETPLGLIINGSYYDKSMFVPKPLQLFPTLGDTLDLGMSQRLLVNWSVSNHGKTQGDTIVTDRYDSTISYGMVTAGRGNAPLMFKLKESNGNVNIVNSISYGASIPASNPVVRCVLGQDASYVYYIMSCNATFTDIFVKVDKSSLTMTTVETFGTYSWGNLFGETDTYIYYGRKSGYGTNIVKRFNKITQTITDTFAETAKTSTIYFSSNYSNPINISSTNFYTYHVFHNSTTNKFGITRYTWDLTQTALTSILTEADCSITWGTVTQLPVFATNAYVHYETFITNASNGNNYLNVAIWESGTSATPANLSSYGIYTFLIDNSTNTLTFKGFMQPSSDYFRGFIGVNNNNFLVTASPTACYFLNFDTTNEKFAVTDSLSNQPSHIGADQAGNIWIVNALKEIEYITPYTPSNIIINWEKSSYQYTGTNINTYITIEAKNSSGIDVAVNLNLTLKGGAVFTSSGTKTDAETTLTTGAKQIPVTINSAGSVTVYPQLVM